MIDTRTDCHCHILPGLDDGAGSLEESIALAKRQVSWGFRKAVCTSHRVGKYPNVPEVVTATCRQLQEALRTLEIPLELTPSMEYRLIPGDLAGDAGEGLAAALGGRPYPHRTAHP